jgi:hypothetical protein
VSIQRKVRDQPLELRVLLAQLPEFAQLAQSLELPRFDGRCWAAVTRVF